MVTYYIWVLDSNKGFGGWSGKDVTVKEFYDSVVGPGWFEKNNSKREQVQFGDKKISSSGAKDMIERDFPLLRKSEIEGMVFNDLFRAIHDILHHSKSGN